MEHFLKTYDIVLLDHPQYLLKSLLLVVVLIGLDRWRPEEDVVSEE